MKLYKLWLKIKHRNFLEVWSMIYRFTKTDPSFANQWALDEINKHIGALEKRWSGADKI